MITLRKGQQIPIGAKLVINNDDACNVYFEKDEFYKKFHLAEQKRHRHANVSQQIKNAECCTFQCDATGKNVRYKLTLGNRVAMLEAITCSEPCAITCRETQTEILHTPEQIQQVINSYHKTKASILDKANVELKKINNAKTIYELL